MALAYASDRACARDQTDSPWLIVVLGE
jgi:hypothetical protein